MKYTRSQLISSLCLGCASLFLTACSKDKEKKEIVRPIEAMQVGVVSNIDKTILNGKAKATREVNIAFEVSGRIVTFAAEVGDEVKEGDILAQLDPRDYQNAVTVAEAEVERAAAMLQRVQKAFKGNAVSAQAVTNAEAQTKAAEAALRIAKKQSDDTTIRAPFSGRIVATYAENFENTVAKQKVLRLLDLSKIEMVVNVPEKLIPNVPYVETINVTFSAFPNVKIPAKLKQVGSEASELTRTYPVTLIMDQPKGIQILPGMAGEAIGTAKLPADRFAGGITVLPSSIASSNGDSHVWVINPDSGTVTKTKVTVSRINPSGVVITEGITPGQWIATAGAHSLTEGQKVRILGQ